MVWVVANENFSWKPKMTVTIDFRAGQTFNMPRAAADKLLAEKKIKLKNDKTSQNHVQEDPEIVEMGPDVVVEEPVNLKVEQED